MIEAGQPTAEEVIPRFRTAGVLRKRSKAAERSARYDVRSSTDRAEDVRELKVRAVSEQ